MKTLGISITQGHLSALLWEQSLFASKKHFHCTVPCREPYGGQDDAASLADEVRSRTGSRDLPPVVLSLPASWTFLRQIELPVPDLQRAKKIHLSELEGGLPLDDEAILSDLLPSPPGQPGKFVAVAARRDAVEKTVGLFTGAGFRVDRVVTDHVSILSAFLSARPLPGGIIVSTLSDIVALRIEGGAVSWARQFPSAMASDAAGLAEEWRRLLQADPPHETPMPVSLLGDAPAALAVELAGASVFRLPEAGDASPLAYGAARVFSHAKELGGFSLRTSAESESELGREKKRLRIAAIAAAVAAIMAIASLEVAMWAQERKVSAVRAQIRKEFSEAVPGAKAAVQETAQIRGKIQSLRRQQKEMGIEPAGLSASLMKVSQALTPKENVVMKEISCEAGKIRLSGEAGDSQLVEKYRTALAAAFGPEISVTVQESRGVAKSGSIRFTILIEKGGAGRAS